MSTPFDRMLAKAQAATGRFRGGVLPHLIDGRPDPGDGRSFETVNPADHTVLRRVAWGGEAEIDRAGAGGRLHGGTQACRMEPADRRLAGRDRIGSRTAALLAEIGLEAGLPPGALNMVHGFGEEAGAALTRHPAIKAIAFVGESATGSRIMAHCQ